MGERRDPLQVAIVGLGHLHPRYYVPHFEAAPHTHPMAAVEADKSLRESFCAEFGLRGYATLDELLDRTPPDIAALFLPHADCPEAAEQCAEAGVHLMVEKPMAASVEGAKHIVEAARRAGVKLTTGYCWRFHPVALEFQRLIASGAIGQVIAAEGRCAAGRLYRYIEGNAAWMLESKRSGGGPMYNLGVHWIDLLRFVLCDEVVEVSGRNVKVNTDYDIEDNSFAHLRFSRGAIAALDISYTVPDAFPHGRDLYFAVRGTKGVLSWAPAYEGEKDELFLVSDAPEFDGAPRRTLECELHPTPGYSGYMGLTYVRTFAEAILNDGEPTPTGEDGVAALRVVQGIYRSASEKRWMEVAS